MPFRKLKQSLRSLSTALSVWKTINKIKDANYSLIFAPFNGAMIPTVVRELTQAQIISCGDFSMIETFDDKISRENGMINLSQVLEYADRHHAIVKKALVYPSYDQLIELVGGDMIKGARQRAEEISAKLSDLPRGPERDEINRELDAMMVWTDLILPDDYTGTIVSYVLGVDKSDIREITKEILLKAASLAERGHDNPADHISGVFTDLMRDDINVRAWNILAAERKEKKRAN